MAQTATLLAIESMDIVLDDKSVVYFAGIDGARFKRPVEPGDQLMMEVTLDRAKAGIYKFTAKAFVGEELACEAELLCTMRRVDA
jgi:3-hydroxyacyl-[acyl-carrier-protein] dehydratase